MKAMTCAVLAATILMPLSAFAQSTADHVTRAQVRNDLIQLESVGYRPSTHDADYPGALMAAEAKVAALHDQDHTYGGNDAGSHRSGASKAN